MKSLHSGFAGSEWDSDMLSNLSFIKKKLRYPLSKFTLLPVAVLGVSVTVAIFLSYHVIAAAITHHKSIWAGLLLLLCLPLAVFVIVRRYWQTLHFTAIPTAYFNTDNQIILQRFLQAQHLAFARHPDAPEVFQIMSKAISTLKDEREIVVFIADDQRILINSHFTQTGTNFTVGKPHHLQIAAMLRNWLNAGGRTTAEADLSLNKRLDQPS